MLSRTRLVQLAHGRRTVGAFAGQERTAQRGRARTRLASAVQHFHTSHLDDEFTLMQQSLHPDDHAQTHNHALKTGASVTPRPHAGQHHHHADAEPHAIADLTECEDPTRVCELDIRTDPVETMQQLRRCLIDHGSAVLIVVDSRPDILLDAVGVLHILNQDLRLEEDYSTAIMFQPLTVDQRESSQGSGSMALLVTRAKAPELLQQRPTSFIGNSRDVPGMAANSHGSNSGLIQPSSTTSEVWDMADMLMEKLDTHMLTQLRCVGPRSLVVAFRALRRTRKLVKLAGDMDMLVSPHIATENGVPMICFNCWRKRVPVPVHVHVGAHPL